MERTHWSRRAVAALPSLAATLLLSLLCSRLSEAAAYQSNVPLAPDSVRWSSADNAYIVTFTLDVTLQVAAPDCYQRPVILVSGIFQPTLEVANGDILKIKLRNNLPKDYPSLSNGLSIHYHGLSQRGPAAWLDGVSFVNLCPVMPGTQFNYEFQITDPPGTYLWHDHSGGFKGDGLQGALIVRPARGQLAPRQRGVPAPGPEPWQYDAEHTMLLTDWYHSTMSSLMMRLNMPFDAAKVTNTSGAWNWIGNPQAILVNGNGFFGDCQLFPGLGGNAAPPACAPTSFTVAPGRSAELPWASANSPGCTHTSLVVQPGKTYRLRVINAGLLVYMTVCFEGHNVTVIAADGTPTEPYVTRCVDVNSGQRVDVLLKADQESRNYWVIAAPQYRTGAPSGYAVLSYQTPNSTALAFPPTPAPQPVNVTPTPFPSLATMLSIDRRLLSTSTDPALAGWLSNGRTLKPPAAATKLVVFNLSQPLLPSNGIIRWALNNVVTPRTPPCTPLLSLLRNDSHYLQNLTVADPNDYNNTSKFLGVSLGTSNDVAVHNYDTTPAPIYPQVGLHMVELTAGAVVDVVINNGPANGYNGDYTPNGAARNASEQHPFHLHGHHFWVLAVGLGVYNPNNVTLNTDNPQYRDVVTVPTYGYAVIRFVANNPGVWPLHCHITAHMFMGQQVYFVEDIGRLAPPPARVPKCPQQCSFNFAPYDKPWLAKTYGDSGFELPPL